MSRIVCTHIDLDGLGCQIVFDYFKIPYDKILSCDYNRFDDEKEFNQLLDYDEIIMTDYSVSKEIVEKLLSKSKVVKILDHHENEEVAKLQDINNSNFTFIYDTTKTGTLLTFEYFEKGKRVKKSFYQLMELINCYDLFKKEDPLWEQAQDLNRVLYGCLSWGEPEMEKFTWVKELWLNKIEKSNEWHWTDFEKTKVQNAIDRENKQFSETEKAMRIYTDSKEKKFGVSTAKSKVSIVASRLLEKHTDLDYIIIINTFSGKWDKISVRSLTEERCNCNHFVECKGHDKAAGGEVDPKFAYNLLTGRQQLTYKETI